MSAFTRLNPHLCKTYQCSFIIMESFIGRKFKRSTLVLWIIAAAFGITMQKAQACNINVTAVNFGSYDVFSNAASDSTGNIGVNCPSGFGYTIGLSAGSGTYEQRGMSSGFNTLNYNLYTAANRALVWGDATYDSAIVSGIGSGQSVNHVVYGRIPPNQNVPAGNYSDTINVMITF
ncbi:MAG: spore coat U domain-containing protein [Amylibacter sp.]|nr:spore coat U domain-containing protein [Amylibacter sp.]